MKAAVFQGIGLLHRLEEMPEPHQVVVKVQRSGICGADVAVTSPRQRPSAFGTALDMLYAPGAVLGHEFAGEVVEVGMEVRHLKVGDRIAPMFHSGCGGCLECLLGKPLWCSHAQSPMGGYAEYALSHEDFCVKLPEALSWDSGALIEPMASSLHATILAQVKPGDRILVLGAGAIGLGIAFFARQLGAGPIAVSARSSRRADLARTLGADAFLVQHSGFCEEVTDHLGGAPDIVFEATGVSGLVNQAIAAVRRGGTILVAGVNLYDELTGHAGALMKELRMQYACAYTHHDFEIASQYLSKPNFPTCHLVGQVVPLLDFPALFESLRTEKVHCKVLVAPWG